MSVPAIEADRLGVRYDLRLARRRAAHELIADAFRRRQDQRPGEFWALRDVSFSVDQGEVLGVVGRNGAGKTTLLLAIAGSLRPDAGTISTFGSTSTLLTLGAGFDGNLTGRENIYLNGAYLGLTQRQVRERLDEIVEFSELGPFIDVAVRKYSSGMRARLGFAIASHIETDILLLDEVFGVGDASFKRKSKDKLDEIKRRAKAIVIVTHQHGFVRDTCTKALWLDGGTVKAVGRPEEVVERYLYYAEHHKGPVRTLEPDDSGTMVR